MRSLFVSAAFAAALGISSVAALAAPAQPGADPAYSEAPAVTLVAGGCGIGFHRGPYGGCRRNGPAFRRFVGPRCVWRRGPYGHMRRFCR